MVFDTVLEIEGMDVGECEGTRERLLGDAGGRLGSGSDGSWGGIGMVVWAWRLRGVEVRGGREDMLGIRGVEGEDSGSDESVKIPGGGIGGVLIGLVLLLGSLLWLSRRRPRDCAA